jgi:hypothetical protein
MAIADLADVQAKWYGPEVQAQLDRSFGKGLRAGVIFLTSRVKELLAVPAPRARVIDPYTGIAMNIETAKASPGAPPRKFEGRLRSSITYEMVGEPSLEQAARVGTNVIYARQLEFGGSIHARNRRMLRWVRMPGTFATNQRKITTLGVSVFRRTVDQPAHPFLGPAMDAQQGNLFSIIHGGAG